MSAIAATTTSKKSWANVVGKSNNEEAAMETVLELEIHEDISMPVKPQSQQFASGEKKNYSTEVDPIALEVARDFYECHHEQIIGITRRNDLQQYFFRECPNAGCDFPVVLYALAKGLRLVNCFNRGQDLEWRAPQKNILKKKHLVAKKPIKQADGWSLVGKAQPLAAVPEPVVSKPPVEYVPSPKFSREVDVPQNQKPIEEIKMDDVEIINKIGQYKNEIKTLDNEIECLLSFHREHLREMKRLESYGDDFSTQLAKFHDQSATNLENKLDELQSQANQKIKAKNQLCDLLKQ